MSSKDFGTIIEIGDILVSEDVVTEFFACDYPVCKGCCCIIGDSGAPLKEEELEPLEAAYDAFSPLMSQAGRDAVTAKGFFEIDREGDIVTPVVPGREECAYCQRNAIPEGPVPVPEAGFLQPLSHTRCGLGRWENGS